MFWLRASFPGLSEMLLLCEVMRLGHATFYRPKGQEITFKPKKRRRTMWNVMSDLIRDPETARRYGCTPGECNPDGDPLLVARYGFEDDALARAQQERDDGATLAYAEWEG
jgi:hypothetical protein